MAPLPHAGRIAGTNRRFLERPTIGEHSPILPPLYTSTFASNCPSDFDYDLDLDLDSDYTTSPQSIRALYAQSFHDRSASSYSRPARRMRKNMKEMTGFGTTDEEFEALPSAVRKKYFSTLERLSYAQDSRLRAAHELPIQSHRKSSLADRRGVNVNLIEPGRLATHRQHMNSRRQSTASLEESWFLNFPNSIKNKHSLSRKKQTSLASRSRDSLTLTDDDEETLNRVTRQGRNFSPMSGLSLSDTARESTDSLRPNTQGKSTSNMASQMYESFRWMDEEQDLDLKLALDDYHANLDGVVLPTTSSIRRPSFRRQLSVSKIPFGRNSISTLPESEPSPTHGRHRSRTMSLGEPKQEISNLSIVAIDPSTTHYQDPEARLKLRVYLASPKNFDEAIEFGFPSMDGLTDNAEKMNKPPVCKSVDAGREEKSFSIERDQSFYNDDTVSSFEDDISMADPDSPLTPRGELGFRPQNRTLTTSASSRCMTLPDFTNPASSRPVLLKQAEPFTHNNNAGSREMTLRMTLTRPDLRADETAIYGWQQCKSRIPEEPSRSLDEKSSLKSSLGGYADGWGSAEKETGVVKRFWKKVKSTQRKAT
ncbi:uncharacterized protein L3040_009509 [Drepanopeziza brunnea f. sp. 'multigermtubi']|uniref:Mucin n=1 Tax=Marssonina brunnea f. sp. multigermtubi (strain MB_m1) TaxID=1072389 RepID=K1WUY8_MARBU|nr:mucin [Drepanopeziza brunnea f. sp. 'multigermtubi' MB_m1]EKD16257.1 mucin [Drepanopeziza brunnea f. sp. 'multigermtubi' MB_m1]KAJ5032920.1 hypothetical protein L3040_009509 [Drepanopeziza brunnea f. sp. 'multigermtubi']